MENLLKKEVKEFEMNAGVQEFISYVIGIVVAIVVIVAVAIPVTNQVITSANITDPTTQTVLGVVIPLMGIAVILVVTKLYSA